MVKSHADRFVPGVNELMLAHGADERLLDEVIRAIEFTAK